MQLPVTPTVRFQRPYCSNDLPNSLPAVLPAWIRPEYVLINLEWANVCGTRSLSAVLVVPAFERWLAGGSSTQYRRPESV